MSGPVDTRRGRVGQTGRTSRPRAQARVNTGVRRQTPQQKAESRSRPQPLVWSLLLLAISISLLAAMLDGKFRVQHVTVAGRGLPRGEVIRASGLMGQNIFSVRSDQVIERLAAVGQIAVQRVDTSFPNQVTIYARRRVPMVGWRRGQSLFLLDPDGRIIRQVRTTTLPIITGTDGNDTLGPGAVTAVREAVRLLPATPGGAIAGFTYDRRSGLSITGAAGWHAIVGTGSPQTMVTRVAILVSVLRQKPQNNGLPLRLVNLRGPGPYVHYGP